MEDAGGCYCWRDAPMRCCCCRLLACPGGLSLSHSVCPALFLSLSHSSSSSSSFVLLFVVSVSFCRHLAPRPPPTPSHHFWFLYFFISFFSWPKVKSRFLSKNCWTASYNCQPLARQTDRHMRALYRRRRRRRRRQGRGRHSRRVW